jgi:CheY-like chemotaxis protein
MDVKMADLDGFSATRRLAGDETTKAIPVIAVTASALGDMRKAAREAGCTAYLPKPVRAEALFTALSTHLGVKFVRDTPEDHAQGPATPMPKHAPLAARLKDAIAIGAITDLQTIAETLAAGDEADAALGRRINALSSNFDFAGLTELAATLETLDRRG